MRCLSEVEAELLVALFHLRYLSTDQIRGVWFPDRTLNATRIRLSRLRGVGVLERCLIQDHPHWRSAWRLGGAGFRRLRELRPGRFQPYPPVKEQFLVHLIETNACFLALAGSEWRWEALPFRWLGSHRLSLTYTEVVRCPETGVARRRNRVLRPDAMVEPRQPGGDGTPLRVFLELDRATESLRSATDRTNIAAKLRAYDRFLRGPVPGKDITWYERSFPRSTRAPRVLFVVRASSRSDVRVDNIRREARRHAGLVQCVSLDAAEDICRACAVTPAAPHTPPAKAGVPARCHQPLAPAPQELSSHEILTLRELLGLSYEAYRRLHRDSRVRPRFEDALERARPMLHRLTPAEPTETTPALSTSTSFQAGAPRGRGGRR